jgi:Tfp pilus assembly PilM family ATPase
MPRIFAIDWDRNEARAILMSSGPTGTSVSGVWAAKLEPAEGTSLSGKQVGARLAEVIGRDLSDKATTIVGVGRDHVQIKLLSLPPAPDEELPDLVRFQAEREFTALGSEAALDYIPLSGDADTQHQVLAVALSPAGITEAREAAQGVGLEVDRITVRALAAVSLVERAGAVGANAVTLIVNPLGDEADLIVLDVGKAVLMRTVRLPDPDQQAARQRTLTGEIRRTVAAARQQLGDRPIEQVLLCGNSSAVDQVDGLGEDLGLTVKMFDPAAHAPSGFAGSRVPPASLARFSSVLGMALAEADRRPPIVDFLNVRKKVERARFTREHAIAAGAAAALLFMFGMYLWWQNHKISSEMTRVEIELKQHKKAVKELAETKELADAVATWDLTRVNWLDELTGLSIHMRPKLLPKTPEELRANGFPENSDVMIKQQLTLMRPLGRNPEGGSILVVNAVAKTDNAAAELEDRLFADERLGILPEGGERETSVPGYQWKMDFKINVPPYDEAEVQEAVEEAKNADAAAAKSAEPTPAGDKGKEKSKDSDKKETTP